MHGQQNIKILTSYFSEVFQDYGKHGRSLFSPVINSVTDPIFTKLYVNDFCTESHENRTRHSRLSCIPEGQMDLASTQGIFYCVENSEINLLMLYSGTFAVRHETKHLNTRTLCGKNVILVMLYLLVHAVTTRRISYKPKKRFYTSGNLIQKNCFGPR